jgi:hypothetical protein
MGTRKSSKVWGRYGRRKTHISVLIQSLGIPRSFSYSAIAIRGLRTTTPPMSKKTALRLWFGGMVQTSKMSVDVEAQGAWLVLAWAEEDRLKSGGWR